MAKKKIAALTEAQFLERLRTKYQAPEWAFFTHVPCGTGSNANRYADGVALNTWPSRGFEIIGFEVKSSRSDFLSEIKNPAKSHEIQKYCDRWYMVTMPDIVREGELPKTWGLMVPHGTGLRIVKEAPELSPEPVTIAFVAALARTINKADILPEEILARIDAAAQKAEASAKERLNWRIESAEKRKADLEKDIAEFERLSGLSLRGWKHNATNVVKAMQALEEEDLVPKIEQLIEKFNRYLPALSNALIEIKTFRTDLNSDKTSGDLL